MIKIEFWGAAKTVTGSKHLIHANGKRILLEYGMFQGHREEAERLNREVPFPAPLVDALLLSHAHIDHSGMLPVFIKKGYKGKIYATPATIDLVKILLQDSAKVQEKDIEYVNKKHRKKGLPLKRVIYTVEDAFKVFPHFVEKNYHEVFELGENIKAEFFDAGHILGSSQIILYINDKKLCFTGDLGRKDLPVIRDPEEIEEVDYVISEATYGARTHKPITEAKEHLRRIIERVYERKGKIIIPAFSVGRTQGIVLLLHELMEEGKLPDIPIWVDSPLSANVTEIFKKHPECFDEETYWYIVNHENPFGFERLKYVQSVEESKALNHVKESCIIISASGMCEGGRVLHHLKNSIEDPKNLILIVGFQAKGTLGRRIREKEKIVRIFGEEYERKAEVEVMDEFSAHADKNDLINFFKKQNPKKLKKIFLVHGENEEIESLKITLMDMGFKEVYVPERGDKAELD